MALSILPSETVQMVAEHDPQVIRERLASRTAAQSFLPRHPSDHSPVFEGSFSGDTFRLRMIKHSVHRLNPIVRGTIREWRGGADVDARISLNVMLAAQCVVLAIAFFAIVGLDFSAFGQVIVLFGFIGTLSFNRSRVREVATAFRREMAIVAELHDTWNPNSPDAAR